MAKFIGAIVVIVGIVTQMLKMQGKKTTYKAEAMEPIVARKMGIYEKYVKRVLDIICASSAIICFSPLYLIIAVLVRVKLGSPVLFTQERPGLVDIDGKEIIFKMYKFRTMTNEKDKNGNLLPDDIRLTKFGKWLRNTSLDELPEAFNILNGTMSVIGPRPQLVRDLVYMNSQQRMRHTAKPGLSGLAQVSGRNAISWEDKLEWDQEYIKKVTLWGDIKIILETIKKALIKHEGISQDNMETAEDFGDYLLHCRKIGKEEYEFGRNKAIHILKREDGIIREPGLVSIIMPSYNTASYIKESIYSVIKQTYTKWELIIVDDCSTDDFDGSIKEIEDKRIRVLKNEKNFGAAFSRNKALREAKGQWIAFLDSDDLWISSKLEKQIEFMEKNNYNFSYTEYEEIDRDGNERSLYVTGPKKITKKGMLRYCWPGCLTVMYNAQAVGLVQIEKIEKNNDYAMWLVISKKENCYLLNEKLGMYRRGRVGSISSISLKTLIKWHYRLFRICEKKGIIQSCFCAFRNIIFGIYKKIMFVHKDI